MDFDSKDPQGEIIEPTVDGVLGIMRACKKEAATVRRVVFTSSAGTVNVQREQLSSYDESHWSDVDFISSVKMTGWAYFVSKIRAERAAREFAEENGMELISVIPPLVVGPFVSSTMPPSMVTALSPITGNSAHYSILKQIQLVHLHDLCDAHVFLLEHPHASSGRYICSSHDATIFQLATIIRDLYPRHYANVPTKFEGIEENIRHVHFSSQKLLSLGFKFQHSVEEMFRGAIDCCREKGFIPLYTTNIVDVEELDVRTYDEANRDVKDVNMQVAEEVEKKKMKKGSCLPFHRRIESIRAY